LFPPRSARHDQGMEPDRTLPLEILPLMAAVEVGPHRGHVIAIHIRPGWSVWYEVAHWCENGDRHEENYHESEVKSSAPKEMLGFSQIKKL
jgi:hypothetical protein